MSTSELFMVLLMKTAEVKMKSAAKLCKIRETRQDHLKNIKELQKLQKASGKAGSTSSGTPASKKKAKQASSGDKEAADKEAAEATQAATEMATAMVELKDLEERLAKERAQWRQTAWLLGAEKKAALESTVSPDERARWSSTRLKCSSRTIRDREALQDFTAQLGEAPCLEALQLSLSNKTRTRRALRKVLRALPAAPAQIKELDLTFGVDSREDVFALLGRVAGHLEKLTVEGPYQHGLYDSPEVLQRFWTAVEGTGVSTLALPPACFTDSAGVQLQPAKWRLQSLSAGCLLREKTHNLLPALIRANAATLREVKLGWVSMPTNAKAVFTALTACPGLVEAWVPCCKELALLERWPALTKLTVMSANLLLGGDAQDVKALAKTLSRPAVASRIESLSLMVFKLNITGKAVLAVYQAVRALRKLKSLSVECCDGFDAELKATLRSLPLLEELKLADGDDTQWQPRALDDLTPANAPALKTLRLHPALLGSKQRVAEAARVLEQRFAAAGRTLEVRVEKSPAEAAEEQDADSDCSTDDEDGSNDGTTDDDVSEDEEDWTDTEEEEDEVDDDALSVD